MRAGGHQCTPHTLIVDMVHHNNAIKLHEIQQKVIEDHVNFQYFHFYTECFSWIPWKDRMNIFSRMKLGSIGPKGEGEDGTGLAIGPLLHGGSICYVLPSLIMRFSTIMPAWPESMRCCGRARAGILCISLCFPLYSNFLNPMTLHQGKSPAGQRTDL